MILGTPALSNPKFQFLRKTRSLLLERQAYYNNIKGHNRKVADADRWSMQILGLESPS